MATKDECVCVKYAEQRRSSPGCMAFWCPVHDDIEGAFARLEEATMPLGRARQTVTGTCDLDKESDKRIASIYADSVTDSEVEPDG